VSRGFIGLGSYIRPDLIFFPGIANWQSCGSCPVQRAPEAGSGGNLLSPEGLSLLIVSKVSLSNCYPNFKLHRMLYSGARLRSFRCSDRR
jgi:hypothetical protein